MIFNEPVPAALMLGTFGTAADGSSVIGPMETAGSAARIRWTADPDGTIDHLMVLGEDGRLHQAVVYGQPSALLAGGRACQPVRHGHAAVAFTSATAVGTQVLHLAYLASAAAGGRSLTVTYGNSTRRLTVQPGLHSAYLPERGSVSSVTVSGPALGGVCVGSLQAGVLVPSVSGLTIPAAY